MPTQGATVGGEVSGEVRSLQKIDRMRVVLLDNSVLVLEGQSEDTVER